MPGECKSRRTTSSLEEELYFLISKFLSDGPCKRAAELLRREIEEFELMPKRTDWLGNEHKRTFNELEKQHPHISGNHLLQICSRIGPILDREVPSIVPGILSLLGAGRQSLLRKKEDFEVLQYQVGRLAVRRYGAPLYPPPALQDGYPPNITQVLQSRELSGPVGRSHALSSKLYAKQQAYRRLLGHLSSVYCVLFDRSGQYIFTGADDLLVKIWNARDGRLIATLRGHSAEITDMAVSYENTVLAAGSCDKIIRVWCIRSTSPVAVLVGHTGIVTSLQFCPYARGDRRYLVSTGNDGCVCFWQWSTKSLYFNPKPLKFTERNRAGAQMVCSSFSPGGVFLATGSTDHHVRIYNILGANGPEKIAELECHSDRVDSLQFANLSCSFITGSKDGTALVWRFERQKWNATPLKMSTRLPGSPAVEVEDQKQKLKVTMVGWNSSDTLVITAVNDRSLKVWNSFTGKLHHILTGHEDEVFVLENHPQDPRILLSGGHDGRIILWDLVTGCIIKSFFNVIEGQGHGAVFDCKFSPDGMTFASTDSHGHLSIFGFGTSDRYKKLPEELFFHTDYRPLIRDANHHVLDEQTQCAPHLMPPPFLVDIDGNPYPPHYQRLVPGRENCQDSQLIPYIAVSANGAAEILEPVRPLEGGIENPLRSTIDEMIERLQMHNNRHGGEHSDRGPLSPRSSGTHRLQQGHSPGHSRVGMRRTGDIEGVRQSSGNWQSRGETLAMMQRLVVKPLQQAALERDQQRRRNLGEQELNNYNREMRRRSTSDFKESYSKTKEENLKKKKKLEEQNGRRKTRQINGNVRRTRSEDPNDSIQTLTDTSDSNGWDDSSDNSASDSGDYSDWVEDSGVRHSNARSTLTRKTVSSREGEDDDDEEEEEDETKESETAEQDAVKEEKGSRSRRRRHPSIQELPEEFRPPEWLTGTMPHRSPYVPQIGDEVVYFRQGHQLYVEAVRRAKIYGINLRNQPWKKLNLREQEIALVSGITYEIGPPRLVCLTLSIIEPGLEGNTGESFSVRYHDMADVIDFILLRQVYDNAMAHNWKPGDRFRSEIDKAWWLGTIQHQSPLQAEFPDSMFQSFLVLWDNGESERMSPWDFEPVDESRLPSEHGGSVEILPEEKEAMMYVPKEGEWGWCGRDLECERIIHGLEWIMQLSIAEPLIAPVDLNRYPAYAMVVEYPIDLSLIKARLENRFYRRLEGLKFDIGYIVANARKFNESGSRIVKQASLVTESCLRFIDNPHCQEPRLIYQELMEARQSRSFDIDSDVDPEARSSATEEEVAGRRSSKRRKNRISPEQRKRLRLETQQYTSMTWKQQCISFLLLIVECEDSTPFRQPVNLRDYPDYRDIIDHPVDLSTIKDKLETNQYNNPIEFCRDMRLMFQNSRNYNINKKSRIYSMTIRLSAMFEEQIRSIISDWRSAVKYEEKVKNNQYVSNRRRPVPRDNSTGIIPSPSTSRMSNRMAASRRNRPSLRRNVFTSVHGSSRKNGQHGASSSSNRENERKHRSTRRSNSSKSNGLVKSNPVTDEDEEDDDEEEIVKRSSERHRRRRVRGNALRDDDNDREVRQRHSERRRRNAIRANVLQEHDYDIDGSSRRRSSERHRKKTGGKSGILRNVLKSEDDQSSEEVRQRSSDRRKKKRSRAVANGNMGMKKPQTRSKTVPLDRKSRRRQVVNYRELDDVDVSEGNTSDSEDERKPNRQTESEDDSTVDSEEDVTQVQPRVSPRKLNRVVISNVQARWNLRNSSAATSVKDDSSKSSSNNDDNSSSSNSSDSNSPSEGSSNSRSSGSDSESKERVERRPETEFRRTSARTKNCATNVHRSKSKEDGIETRNRGLRTVRYQEDSEFDYEVHSDSSAPSDGGHLPSISSRGRRRKLSRHVRALLGE